MCLEEREEKINQKGSQRNFGGEKDSLAITGFEMEEGPKS